MASLTEDGDVIVKAPRGRAPEGRFAAPQYTLRDILTVIFFDRWAIFMAFLAPVALGIGASLLAKTTYEAEARLLVLLGRECAPRPEVGEAAPGLSSDREQIVKTEMEILGSRALKADVIRTVGTEELYSNIRDTGAADRGASGKRRPRAVDLALDRFEKDLKLTPVQGSSVIQLAYRHPDPNVAAKALNLLVHFYMEKRREVFGQSRSGMIQERCDQYSQRLREAEQRLQAFRDENQISNIEEQANLLLRQESEQVTAMFQLDERIRGLEAQGQGLKRRIAATPPRVLLSNENTRTQSLDSARATLTGLELRRRDLLTEHRESSRVIADVDAQIAQARQFLQIGAPRAAGSTRHGRNPVLDDLERDPARLEAELQGLRARKTEIDQNVRKIRERIDGLARLDQQLRALERDRSIIEESYRTYATRPEAAKITEEFDKNKSANNVRVIASAEPPSVGASLRAPILAASVLLGLLGALVAAFVAARSRQTYLTPEDVERSLGLPVLLAVPQLGAASAGGAHRLGKRLWK